MKSYVVVFQYTAPNGRVFNSSMEIERESGLRTYSDYVEIQNVIKNQDRYREDIVILQVLEK